MFRSNRFLVVMIGLDIVILAGVNLSGRVDPILVGLLLLVVSPLLAYGVLRLLGSTSGPE